MVGLIEKPAFLYLYHPSFSCFCVDYCLIFLAKLIALMFAYYRRDITYPSKEVSVMKFRTGILSFDFIKHKT